MNGTNYADPKMYTLSRACTRTPFGNRILQERFRQKLSLTQIEANFDIPANRITGIERRGALGSLETMTKLCAVLGCDLAWLLTGSGFRRARPEDIEAGIKPCRKV
jgi:transcriptional regulator with XRE-family HTH domain